MVPASSKTMLSPVKKESVERKLPEGKAHAVNLPEEKKVTPVSELEELEALIAEEGSKSYSSYLSVGKALYTIEKNKLYDGKYVNFVEYCRVRWGCEKSYGYDLVGAHKVYTELSTIAEKAKIDRIFTNESQLRPFRKLKSDKDRVLVFNQLVEKVQDGQLTAEIVKEQIDCFDTKTKTFSDKKIEKRSTYTSSTDKISLKTTDIETTESGFSFTKLDDEKVKNFQSRISEVLEKGGSVEIICKPKKVKKAGKNKASAKNKKNK